MSLKEELRKEFNEARKQRNDVKRSAIEAILVSILNIEKSGTGAVASEAEIVTCITKEIKVQKEIAELYKTKDPNKTTEAKGKIECLMEFLPKQLSESEVEKMIKEIISTNAEIVEQSNSNKAKAKGMVIKILMPQIAGQFDKALVGDIVEKCLG